MHGRSEGGWGRWIFGLINSVDPVTHTLVGATLARTGLADRTALGSATLLIGVNLPDIDVLAYAWSATHALWFRRGVTHGVLGLLVLPVALTGVMVLWGRFARRSSGSPPVLPREILLLAGLAVLSHPVLDSLNVYGMRWLMPFSSIWFYGDTLFIVDPWVWAALSAGVWLASRRRRMGYTAAGRPALIALGLMGIYVAGMAVSNVLGRRIVHNTFTHGDVQPVRIMVGPVPISPFTRYVVVDDGRRYRAGTLRWLPTPRIEIDSLVLDRFPSHYAVTAATRGPRVRRFLAWARFPYYQVEDRGEAFLVWIGDARYTLHPEGSWAATAVEVTK